MKYFYLSLVLSLCLSTGSVAEMSPFAEDAIQINQHGRSETSSEALGKNGNQSGYSARLARLETVVERYIRLLELLKANPELAPEFADQMASMEQALVRGIIKEVDDDIHQIANQQLHGTPLAKDSPEMQRNLELLSLYKRVKNAKEGYNRSLQSDKGASSPEPINQADADYIANQKENETSEEQERALNEIRYALSRLKQKIYAEETTVELNLTLNWLKRLFEKAERENLQVPDYLRKEYEKLQVTARQLIAEQRKKSDPENIINELIYGLDMLEKRINEGESAQQLNATLKWTSARIDRANATGLEVPEQLKRRFAELKKKVPAMPDGVSISERGKQQMAAVVSYALNNNGGYCGGDCFEFVWRYLYKSGYGNISRYNDLPRMQSDWARHFSDFMNASQANLDEAGLQRLDTAYNPPITNPHDPRIPKGAVIVVAPGSYGCSHAYAGDIVIKAGEGHFVNDGPRMDYGTRSSWYGKVLGVYVPK